jgi:hypothetical protein
LLNRINTYAFCEDDESVRCVEVCSQALASILIYKSNVSFVAGQGVVDIAHILRKVSYRPVLAAVCTVLVTIVPSPDDMWRIHEDFAKAEVEKVNPVPILKKALLYGYGHMLRLMLMI